MRRKVVDPDRLRRSIESAGLGVPEKRFTKEPGCVWLKWRLKNNYYANVYCWTLDESYVAALTNYIDYYSFQTFTTQSEVKLMGKVKEWSELEMPRTKGQRVRYSIKS